MPERVKVELTLTPTAAARYLYAGERRRQGSETAREAAVRLMSEELQDSAAFLPDPPTGPRPMSALRASSRERSPDGVSAHTQAMRTLRPDGEASA